MEDIPQPAGEPYSEGDTVNVYIAPEDADTQFHGTTGKVVDVRKDEFTAGRELDQYSYLIKPKGNEEALNLYFRHGDLVPSN